LDADTTLQWTELINLARQLEHEGIVAYLEVSRRGGHCWLFTPPLKGQDIRQFGKHLLEKHSIGKVELYPKQDELSTGVGSLVRLPLGIHRITRKRYSFITSEGKPLAQTIREQIRLLANPTRVPQGYIDHILAEVPIHSPPPSYEKMIFAKVHQGKSEHHAGANATLSERIKASISVYDFVSRYVGLDAQSKGFCPFHDDQKKSFSVHRERDFWHCFAGCLTPDGNKGGSVIDFWMKWREKQGQDASFTATITELAKMLL